MRRAWGGIIPILFSLNLFAQGAPSSAPPQDSSFSLNPPMPTPDPGSFPAPPIPPGSNYSAQPTPGPPPTPGPIPTPGPLPTPGLPSTPNTPGVADQVEWPHNSAPNPPPRQGTPLSSDPAVTPSAPGSDQAGQGTQPPLDQNPSSPLVETMPSPPAPPLPVSAGASEWSILLAPYDFDAKTKRNIFVPMAPVSQANSGDYQGPVLPLQRYNLEEIKLLGIIWNVPRPKAMFMDPTKQIHVLERDDRIGNRNGHVGAIREGEVVVIEPTDSDGDVPFTARVMRIQR